MSRTEISGKFTTERNAIAAQVLQARRFDLTQSKAYRNDSLSGDYIYDLNGLENFFNYARSLNNGLKILDIGAGTTQGVWQLSQSKIGQGLDFHATVLRRNLQNVVVQMDQSKIFKTTAERLNGIADQSISGIISHSGIAYSQVSELAVRSMDRVLVSGGALKIDLENQENSKNLTNARKNRQDYRSFVEVLKNLGYDVAHESWRGEIVVAIKPGGNIAMSAQDLLFADEAHKGRREFNKLSHEELVAVLKRDLRERDLRE